MSKVDTRLGILQSCVFILFFRPLALVVVVSTRQCPSSITHHHTLPHILFQYSSSNPLFLSHFSARLIYNQLKLLALRDITLLWQRRRSVYVSGKANLQSRVTAGLVVRECLQLASLPSPPPPPINVDDKGTKHICFVIYRKWRYLVVSLWQALKPQMRRCCQFGTKRRVIKSRGPLR